MKYGVTITPSAKADIFKIRTWLLEENPEGADKWLGMQPRGDITYRIPPKMQSQRREAGLRF